MVMAIRDLSYQQRLLALNLPLLECQHFRGDMITVYIILHDQYKISSSSLFLMATSSTRGHWFKIFKQLALNDVRMHSFSHSVINQWNGIPNEVVATTSLNNFRLFDNYHSNIMYNV